jgi:hypothetical protein
MQWKTVLSGIAALALIAGTGVASAEGQGKKQSGAPQAKGPQATSSMKTQAGPSMKPQVAQPGGKAQFSGRVGSTSQHAMSGTPKGKSMQGFGQSTAQRGVGPNSMTRHAQITGSGIKGKNATVGANRFAQQRASRTTARGVQTKSVQAATIQPGQGRTTITHRGGTLNGLQANAAMRAGATGNVHLTAQQRTKIRQTVINGPGAPRVGRVNFGVRVGTVIPGGFHLVPLPPTLVDIYPTWGGFLYFIYGNEVVVVNPADMTIVAVLPV